MIKDLTVFQNTVEGTVRSEMYRATTVVIDIKDFKLGRDTFPCGDGCDYTLTEEDSKIVQDKLVERRSIVERWENIKEGIRRKNNGSEDKKD